MHNKCKKEKIVDRDIVAIDKLNDDNFEFEKFGMFLLFEKKNKNVIDENEVKRKS